LFFSLFESHPGPKPVIPAHAGIQKCLTWGILFGCKGNGFRLKARSVVDLGV
jgi:hypothetical protein